MLKACTIALLALGVWAEVVARPTDAILVAMSLRQEVMLDRAPAARVVEILQQRFPGLTFILHPTMNGFFAMGSRTDILKMKSLIPDLDTELDIERGREVVCVKYGDLEEVRALLQTLVPYVSVEPGEKEGTLVLEGASVAVEQAKGLLDQLDKPLDQVVLECKLLQGRDLPVEWEARWEGRIKETGQTVALRVGRFKRGLIPQSLETFTSELRVSTNPLIGLESGKAGQLRIGIDDAGLLFTPTVTVEEGGRKMQCDLQGEFKIPTGQARTRTLVFSGLVDLEDGETIVLEGLLSPEEAIEAVTAVPGLADLPVLGPLFRNVDPRGCVFLMVTPNVMK